VTPREIRQHAAERYGWREGQEPDPDTVSLVSWWSELQPSAVKRALSRRDKRTPKSEGGPVTEGVTIRLNAAQKKKALKLAKKAGHKTVSAWVKALVEREVGR